MSTGWTANVATATSRTQAFATAADRAGIVFGPGDVTYLVDVKQFQFWDGAAWQTMVSGPVGVALPPFTIHPAMLGQAVRMNAANYTIHARCQGVGAVSKIGMNVGASSGNVCVAVYASAGGTGPPTTRLATSGSVPCPAAGWATISLGASLMVNQTNYLSIVADNTTATFSGGVGGAVSGISLALGGFLYQDPGFPCPATANPNSSYIGAAIALFGQP